MIQSSAKSKYITLSKAPEEQNFTITILQELADVETPGYIYGDNEASTCLAKFKQVSNRIKHIDTCDHFIIECVNKGRIELKMVISNNSILDMMTKIYQWKLSNKTLKTFER